MQSKKKADQNALAVQKREEFSTPELSPSSESDLTDLQLLADSEGGCRQSLQGLHGQQGPQSKAKSLTQAKTHAQVLPINPPSSRDPCRDSAPSPWSGAFGLRLATQVV